MDKIILCTVKKGLKGASNGISGHYNGRYFRSLFELSYLLYLLNNNIKFENTEKKKHRIEYSINGKNKTYSPDFFLIDTQEIIEIKPYRLTTTAENIEKFKAGRAKLGDKFKALTEYEINFISDDLIKNLY